MRSHPPGRRCASWLRRWRMTRSTVRRGAPPVAGRLATELIARGSATLAVSRLRDLRPDRETAVPHAGRGHVQAMRCPRAHGRLRTLRRAQGGRRPRRRWPGASASGAAATTAGHRRCGRMRQDRTDRRARPATAKPDICVNCYRLPERVCACCGRLRPCTFAGDDHPVCTQCSPRAAAAAPAAARSARRRRAGPKDRSATPATRAALRHRGPCASCGQVRRLVEPPGLAADTCAACAGIAVTHACGDCGTEDKLFEKERCARCSLRRRAAALLSGRDGEVPGDLAGVFEAICSARTPRAALNWLRAGAGAAILADLAAGRLAATHEALDQHPRPRAAGHLRQMLVTGGVLAPRDEELARTEQWLAALLASIEPAEHRRLVRAFATWDVMRRLRRTAAASSPAADLHRARPAHHQGCGPVPRLARPNAEPRSPAAARPTSMIGSPPAPALATPAASWPGPPPDGTAPRSKFRLPHTRPGPPSPPSGAGNWLPGCSTTTASSSPTGPPAAWSCSTARTSTRIAALTTSQVTGHGTATSTIRLGQPSTRPRTARPPAPHLAPAKASPTTASATPRDSPWLFPGLLPGPLDARLGQRLRALGIPVKAARRAALIDLAAQLPAAVLADLLGLHPTTAVKWMHQAGGDWNRYAAQLARTRNHQP